MLELLYIHNRRLEWLIDEMSDKTNVVGINPSYFSRDSHFIKTLFSSFDIVYISLGK